MKMEIRRIPALYVAGLFALCYFLGASAWLLLLALIGLATDGNEDSLRGAFGIAATTAAATWLVLAVGLTAYNQIARWLGGIKISLNIEDEKDPEQLSPADR